MKPISRSFKLEIKKAVHNLNAFLGMPDDGVVRRLLDAAHGAPATAAAAATPRRFTPHTRVRTASAR
jgi:hypothetical protein